MLDEEEEYVDDEALDLNLRRRIHNFALNNFEIVQSPDTTLSAFVTSKKELLEEKLA